ncbi:MAG: hypothetical protein K1X92_01355 [Bacteroidia bacterium]|nr:hypothetical protein [Bacteroidia bacterium]
MAKQVNFSLQKIITEQFAIFEENVEINNPSQFAVAFDFRLDDKKQIIGVSFRITFAQNNRPFLTLEVSCHFHTTEEAWKSFCQSDQIIIPRQFIHHLCMITVGTCRGVLHSKTENTPLNRFILPLVNVVEMIKEDIVFNLNSQKPV